MATRAYIARDDITNCLKTLVRGLQSTGPMQSVLNTAKAVITNRTLLGESVEGGAFVPYSTRRYYAPVQNRTPGVPAPSGGRTVALSGKYKLRTVAYDEGYGQYKTAMGFPGTPQLSLTNEMLSSMLGSVMTPRKGVLYFGSALANAKAHGHHTGKRPFFNIRPEEQENLYAALAVYLRRMGVR